MSNAAEKTAEDLAWLQDKVIERLRTVHDPEIPVNIYDLGLVYRVAAEPCAEGKYDLVIEMTLTTPNCPIADEIPRMVQRAVETLDELKAVKVELVWEPPWDRSMMSDEARLQLNMF